MVSRLVVVKQFFQRFGLSGSILAAYLGCHPCHEALGLIGFELFIPCRVIFCLGCGVSIKQPVLIHGSAPGILLRKHFLQKCQHGLLCVGADFPHLFHQPDFVHGANLIQHNLSLLALKLAVYA
jgi:hypothetical protein